MRARTASITAAAAAAAIGASAVAASRNANVRRELRIARDLARPIEPQVPAPPLPPPLPPGHTLLLPGRGETFARDTRGAGPAVLLLHGWTASADLNFFWLYEPLAAAGYRVVALDHRGHGRGLRSTEPFSLEACAEDAAALLDVLRIDTAVVLGYSMGGPISMLLARRHPRLVAGLVLQATALEWRGTTYERLVWKGLAGMEWGLRLTSGEGAIERILRGAVEHDPRIAPLVPWLFAEFHRGMTPALVDAGRALAEYDARPWVGSVRLPATVVVTTRDRLVRPHKQRELAAALAAPVLELRGDHDASLIRRDLYVECTLAAVDDVARRAGLR